MPNPLMTPGVPILGQPDPVPYPLGAHALGFTMPAEQVIALHRQSLQEGLQPEVGFVLLWQQCSLALQQVLAQNFDLHERVGVLEAKLGIEGDTDGDTTEDAPAVEGAPDLADTTEDAPKLFPELGAPADQEDDTGGE